MSDPEFDYSDTRDLEQRLEKACDEIIEHKATVADARAGCDAACKTIAAMHAAAWGGEVRGPARGVVEDVQDLYTAFETMRDACTFWKRAADQALQWGAKLELRADALQEAVDRVYRDAPYIDVLCELEPFITTDQAPATTEAT